MAKATPKAKETPEETTTETAAGKAERNLVLFNEEAFDSALELQMSFFETASRFAQEFSDFAARRAEANVEDFTKFAHAKSPPELLQMQLDHMRTMFEDYSKEASRLLSLTDEVVKESGEAVRSSYLDKEELKQAG